MTKQFKELTDTQWDAISPYLNLKRKRKVKLRAVIDALLYMVRVGCQWRNLPANFPKWRAVNYYFERWKKDGTLVQMNDQLNKLDRIQCDRFAILTLMGVDSQSVNLSPLIYEERGININKKVNSRKRQLCSVYRRPDLASTCSCSK